VHFAIGERRPRPPVIISARQPAYLCVNSAHLYLLTGGKVRRHRRIMRRLLKNRANAMHPQLRPRFFAGAVFGGVEVSGCRPLSALFIYRQRVQMNFHQDVRTVNYEFVSLPIWRRLICERWRAREHRFDGCMASHST